jgi:crotonobetaine/carnitine-CoA ligase
MTSPDQGGSPRCVMANSLPELLLASAREEPGRPFLCFGAKTYSRIETADAIARIAGWFRRTGLDEGERVALLLGNQPEFVMAWLGATLMGAVTVPLDPAAGRPELAARLDEIRPRVIIARPSARPGTRRVAAGEPPVQRVLVGGTKRAGTIRWPALLEGVPADGASRSAGVDGLALSARAMAGLLGLGRSDRLMIVEPLFDATAQFSVAMAVAGGAAIVLERGFSPATFWNLARGHGATQVCLSGSQLSRLYEMPVRRADLGHSIRLVLGIGTPPEIHEAFEHRFGLRVVEAFGSAEAGFVTVNPVERGQRKLGTAGLPVPWCEVAVLDEEMRPLGPGAVGPICFRRHRDGAWMRSGALGTTDEEGFFTIVDRRNARSKEMGWR